jgi:microcystin-dependent protein
MSSELDALIALAADYDPITASLSPDTLAVFGYAYGFLASRPNWLAPGEVLVDITDADWDVIEAMVANAVKEIFMPLVGQIVELATAIFPPNMLACDGSSYLRVDYPVLYAVLDSIFIVDADNFIVPDLRDRISMTEGATHMIGDIGGEETHILTVAELAVHDHTAGAATIIDPGHVHTEIPAVPAVSTLGAGVPFPIALPGVGFTGLSFTGITALAASISSTGNSDPHNNMQPFAVLRKAIIAF